jgi:hypothetical protein
MLALPSDLHIRLRSAFLECSEFEDYQTLRSVFLSQALHPFQSRIKYADSPGKLVDLFLSYIIDKRTADGDYVLLLFLSILLQRYSREDYRHKEIKNIYEEIEASSTNKAVETPSRNKRSRKISHIKVPNQKLRIFLCHSSGDKDSVRNLYTKLTNDGYGVWLDEVELIGGQEWATVIPQAVRLSQVILVCLSQTSVNKVGYVQKEIRIALDAADEQPEGSIFIIPVKLEDCKVPDRLSRWQWVDLYQKNGYGKLKAALDLKEQQLQEINS